MKDIDADYYGCRDDDDGVLLPLELEQEKLGTEYVILHTHTPYQMHTIHKGLVIEYGEGVMMKGGGHSKF